MSRPPGPWRQIAVAVLVAVLLAVFVVTRHGTSITRRLASVANTVIVPVAGAVGRGATIARADLRYLKGLEHAQQTITLLRAELAQARYTELRERAAVSQDQTLRALLHLRQDLQLPTVAADVVGLSPASWWESLELDRGTANGVVDGAPVIAPGGVVGRVQSASSHVSTVMLLANGQSGIGVKDLRSGSLGVALGNSVPQRLTVDFFSPTASVRPGDELVTSGLGGVFPSGLAVARVVSVGVGPTGLVAASAQPSVDPTSLQSVLVMKVPAP